MRPIVLTPALLALIGWACAVLWIDGPSSRGIAGTLIAGFLILTVGILMRVRPLARGLLAFVLLFAVVLGWWFSLTPRNDRDWRPEVAHPPSATLDGDILTIRNVRNFGYRTEEDFTVRWEERSYDLSKLRGVDMFLSYWGSPWIAHTVMSWDFGDGQHLAISIETRKEQDEAYSALLGFFRQFELYYVVADERDLVRLRTNYRGEQVYLYPLRIRLEVARAVLLDYIKEINELAEKPRWYNAFSMNCTTAIRHHLQNVAVNNPWDWRILLNGRLDELGYRRGSIDTTLPFAELRRRSEISEKAKRADGAADFSALIRVGLPGARGSK